MNHTTSSRPVASISTASNRGRGRRITTRVAVTVPRAETMVSGTRLSMLASASSCSWREGRWATSRPTLVSSRAIRPSTTGRGMPGTSWMGVVSVMAGGMDGE
ncbi:MAG: hypothetical protein IT437_03920 [Phycisphaerales bacterium]|nr:hypothetical protein [Phycisphaerales bacterium]